MSALQKSILVTGGTGFIGGHAVEWLVRAGFRVDNLDLLTYAGNFDNLAAVASNQSHQFIQGDICDNKLVAKLLSEYQVDVILNMAAETHVDRSIDDAAMFIKTNVEGTYRLLEAAVGHWRSLPEKKRADFRFIQMSTDEVYGSTESGT